MANTVQAILTQAGHRALARSFGGPLGADAQGSFKWSYGGYFKIGTGGWTIVGGEKQPVAPVDTLTNIVSATSNTFWYRKSFVASNILFIAPSSIQFQAFLDLGMANGVVASEPDTAVAADGPKNSAWLAGGAPAFFEIGIFDPQDSMIAYGTFPQEVKLATKALNHLVSITF